VSDWVVAFDVDCLEVAVCSEGLAVGRGGKSVGSKDMPTGVHLHECGGVTSRALFAWVTMMEEVHLQRFSA